MKLIYQACAFLILMTPAIGSELAKGFSASLSNGELHLNVYGLAGVNMRQVNDLPPVILYFEDKTSDGHLRMIDKRWSAIFSHSSGPAELVKIKTNTFTFKLKVENLKLFGYYDLDERKLVGYSGTQKIDLERMLKNLVFVELLGDYGKNYLRLEKIDPP